MVAMVEKCRRCSECEDRLHHWIACCGDIDEPEPEVLPPLYGCKHCSAVGDECEACDGSGVDVESLEGLCLVCKGDGVVQVVVKE